MQNYSTYSIQYLENTIFTVEEDNINSTTENHSQESSRSLSIRFIQTGIASIGIIANLTVIVVFLNHKKLRRKIPNIFIINQVRKNIHRLHRIIYLFIEDNGISTDLLKLHLYERQMAHAYCRDGDQDRHNRKQWFPRVVCVAR